MSEPARQAPSPELELRAPTPAAPLREWLTAMRAAAEPPKAETSAAERRETESALAAKELEPAEPQSEPRTTGWAPRLVTAATKPAETAEDDVAEMMAENMMLKAQLRLEAERRDELQSILAEEIRELRAHIAEEVGHMDDLRAERDLWRARCEALAAPLFQAQHR